MHAPRSPSPRPRRHWRLAGWASCIALVAFLAVRAPEIQQRIAPVDEVVRGPRGHREIALTFDAGGEATGFAELVSALADAGVHSTFFLTGRWATAHPELVRDLIARGHEIGNHTWDHPDLTHLEPEAVRAEIARTEAALAPFLPRTARPLWRAPYGERNRTILRTVREMGLTSVYWSLDSLDSIEPQKTPNFLIERVAHRRDADLDGAIVLMHVGEPSTAAAMPEILRVMKLRGFRPVTVSALLTPR